VDSLHIGLVTETFPPEVNGVAMTLGRLVAGLRSLRHTVEVFRPRQPGDRHNGNASDYLLPGVQLPMYRELRLGLPASARLRRSWTARRPDVLYVATEGPLGWSAIRTARKLDIPVVSGFHTNFQTYSRHYGMGWMEPLVLRYLRTLHRQTRCTLAPTRALATALSSQGFGRVDVMQRGVDTALFSPVRRNRELRRQWGVDDNSVIYLYVGRIAAEKNIQQAVAAFCTIQKLQPAARFVLVGDGPQRHRLQQQHPNFIFCGTRRGTDLAEHYASGDVFLFPSRSETFGNVVTEAMASGLAVVAYNEAAAGEHIRHDETGLLVDGLTPDAFTDAALSLCAQPARVHSLGANAAQYAAKLGWSRVIDRFADVLSEHARRTANEPPVSNRSGPVS